MSYQPKVYRKQGGAEIVVADGGKITVESGGIIDPGPVAASNAAGGLLEIFHVLADQAGGADKDVTAITYKIRVLDVIVVNKAAGGAGDTITVKNGATAITNAIDTNKADTTVTRAGTIDDAQHEIVPGGTLRVSKANGANDPDCDVYVLAMRVA